MGFAEQEIALRTSMKIIGIYPVAFQQMGLANSHDLNAVCSTNVWPWSCFLYQSRTHILNKLMKKKLGLSVSASDSLLCSSCCRDLVWSGSLRFWNSFTLSKGEMEPNDQLNVYLCPTSTLSTRCVYLRTYTLLAVITCLALRSTIIEKGNREKRWKRKERWDKAGIR